MTEQQMASDIKWHHLDDTDNASYPKKIGELYLVRIYTRDKGHHYTVAKLWEVDEYKRLHPNKQVLTAKSKYVFVDDLTDACFRRKSDGSNYVDGWNDLLFASASQPLSKSQSLGSSKVWLDLRNKQSK